MLSIEPRPVQASACWPPSTRSPCWWTSRCREWFEEQEKHNFDQLEGGARTIIQLETGPYGVVFALLALTGKPQPAYLQRPEVQWFGTVATMAYFLALAVGLVVMFPFRSAYGRNNLTGMEEARRNMTLRKVLGLQVALMGFLVGTVCLGVLIVSILWNP